MMRITIVLLFCSLTSLAQSGYRLDFKVHGWKDTTVYLGHYQGESTVVNDTALVNSEGAFSFTGKKTLPFGVYFLVKKTTTANIKVFEFVVGDDQQFSLETSSPDFVTNMKVVGDKDNTLFFENIDYSVARNKEVAPLIKILRDTAQHEGQKKSAREAYDKVGKKVLAHQRELITNNPRTITARMLKAALPLDVPETPHKANGHIDSTFQLKYYRQHYFDNFDLADDAMIRLPQPVYQQKLKEYLENLFVPQPDSVTKAIYGVVAKAKKNLETYKYCVINCIALYQQPKIMGMDEVFVNLYDKYFKTGEMDYWVDARTKKNFQEYADKIRSCMIGRQGNNLIMQDENFLPKSLYDVKSKYTVVYFFRPDCGHCREETPKLVNFYEGKKGKFNLEVFAVSTDTSMKKMREFIKDFNTKWITVDGPRSYIKEHFMTLYDVESTPAIYILDDKKKIIAKKISSEQIEDFLTRYEKAPRPSKG